jgi:hypothetical protein
MVLARTSSAGLLAVVQKKLLAPVKVVVTQAVP